MKYFLYFLVGVLAALIAASCKPRPRDTITTIDPIENGKCRVKLEPPVAVIGNKCALDTQAAVGVKDVDPFTLFCSKITVSCSGKQAIELDPIYVEPGGLPL